MVVNANVFGSFMKDKIKVNIKNNLIIIYKCYLNDISKL